MLRLRTLGGLSIENAASIGGAAAHRRPLALLALLAVEGRLGLSRDKIVALFWPESDAERGRNSLSQVISLLRRELAADDVVLGTAEIRVNTDVLACDVIEFEERIAADDLEAATRLYTGPFLDGVFLKNTPEFERWVDQQRSRLQHVQGDALERLAARGTAGGDHVSAVRFWRQRASLAPSDSRAALKLMEAMVASGDPAGALEHYRVHQALLRDDLGLKPDATLAEFAAAVRGGNGRLVAAGDSAGAIQHFRVHETRLRTELDSEPDQSMAALAEKVRDGDAAPAASGALSTAGRGRAPLPVVRDRSRANDARGPGVNLRRWFAMTAVALLSGLVALGFWRWKDGSATAPNRIVVAPFENRTRDPSLGDIGTLVADWLTDGMAKGTGASVVPITTVNALVSDERAESPLELARRTKATVLVSGGYSRVRDSLEYRAEVLKVSDGSLLASIGPLHGLPSETAAFDSLLQRVAVVHELVREGRAHRFNNWSQPRSMEALRAFNTAQNDHYVHGDWLGAIALYRHAHELDTAWIAPLTQMSSSYANLGRGHEADSVLDIARRRFTSTWAGDRARVEWSAASHRSDFEAQYWAGRKLLALDPIGEAYHAFVGAQRTRRYREALRLAERRDTTYFEREWRGWDRRYLSVLHAVGRYNDELRAARVIGRNDLTNETASLAARALAALGKSRDVDSVVALVWEMPTDTVGPTAGYPANSAARVATTAGWEYLAHGHERLASPMFERALAWYRARPPVERSRWMNAYAEALFLTGRFAEAKTLYDSLSRAAPEAAERLAMLGLTAVMLGDSALRRSVDARLASFAPRPSSTWRGRMAAVRGDCAAAVSLLRAALKLGDQNDVTETAHHRWAAFGKARYCPALLKVLAPRD